MIQPETLFANIGEDRIAYQVCGEGPRDLLLTSGLWSHLDIMWEEPAIVRFVRRLASFGRLVRFDRRGSGMSDRAAADGRGIAEHWIEDCLTVLDAVGAQAPILIGSEDAGPLMLRFADRHPHRCGGLVFVNTTACRARRPD